MRDQAHLDPDVSRGDLEKARAVWLWVQLEAIYPGRWMRSTGAAVAENGGLNPAAVRWARRVAEYQKGDVLQALDWIPDDERLRSFLPTLGEFLELCREARSLRLMREREADARNVLKLTHAEATPAERRESTARGVAACMAILCGNQSEQNMNQSV